MFNIFKVLSLPGSVLWATIFFVMLLVLGIDSEFCNVEALVTGMVDNWPDQLLKHRRLFTVCLCLFLFCLGVPLVTNVRYQYHVANLTRNYQSSFNNCQFSVHLGRYFCFPTDGLLLLLRNGLALGLFLSDCGYWMGLWSREVRKYRKQG